MIDKQTALLKKYTPMTKAQLKGVVAEYAAHFPEWAVFVDGTAFVRRHGPVQQMIWFQKMSSAAYRPTHGISSLVLPSAHIRMLPQTLDVKHREIMTKPLSKLFEEAKAACVDWEGEPLYGLYEMSAPSGLLVEILHSNTTPVQGLTLKAYGGVLRVNDVEAPEMVIWTDTAPERVAVSFKPWEGRTAKLKIWNVWRGTVGGVGVTQAWLGNAGMRVEADANGRELLFRCSDGEGSIAFGDLEARVTLM